MANEYLVRTPTSTGNRKIFTWAGWVKRATPGTRTWIFNTRNQAGTGDFFAFDFLASGDNDVLRVNDSANTDDTNLKTTPSRRDPSSWMHLVLSIDTTKGIEQDRVNIYANGVQISDFTLSNYPTQNALMMVNSLNGMNIGTAIDGSGNSIYPFNGEMFDIFFIDGQALTPDVFGFYKEGKGYQSSGTTQVTDFRPGQWSPHSPRTIKTEINRRGGFGVNGFYLPMNDSSNFGADFHCAPNSIITLKGEDLPQPRNGAPTTTDAYVSELRTDPYAANLVLAVPGIALENTNPELITNGTFDTNTTGWTTHANSISSVVDGVLRARSSSGDLHNEFYQNVTTVVGTRYTVSATVKIESGGNPAWLWIDGNSVVSSTSTSYVTISYDFTATSTTTKVGISERINTYTYYDNISLKVAMPVRDYSADIKGSGTNKTLTAVGKAGVGYETGGYYGSAMQFSNDGTNGAGTTDIINVPTSSDFVFNGDVTIECWMYVKSTPSVSGAFLGQWQSGGGTNRNIMMYLDTSNRVTSYFNSGGSNYNTGASPALALNQWHHIVTEKDGDKFRLYVNGVCVGIRITTPTAGNTAAVPFTIGAETESGGTITGADYGVDSYIQDVRVYKGVAKYKGGFDVPKPYTPVGFGSWRQVPDNCKNNFCTMNPLNNNNITLADGNLTTSEPGSSGGQIYATMGSNTGKWYYEAHVEDVGTPNTGGTLIGINPLIRPSSNTQNRTAYRSSGDIYNDSSGNSGSSSYAYVAGDTIGVAWDADAKRLWFARNGTWLGSGDPAGNSNSNVNYTNTETQGPFIAYDNGAGAQVTHLNFGQNPTFSGQTTAGTNADANGKGLFKYQPPTGFLALCEDNLPTPAIADPGKHFKTVLYTGDGNEGHSITGVGFKPDLVWVKCRSNADNHTLSDTVRGPALALYSDLTNAEHASTIRIQSFNDDGFTTGSSGDTNTNGRTFCAWCWKAGGAAVSNSDGTITSQVSANQTVGFSIVKWTSNGNTSVTTMGHGLAKTPKFMLLKRTVAADNWFVYHESIQTNNRQYVQLNTTSATITSPNDFWSTSSSTFGIRQSSIAANGQDCIAYCWAEIEGYSKFGSYVGNANADGTFIYCGFKPAFVITKRTDGTSNWLIHDSSRDSVNPVMGALYANTSTAEGSAVRVDFVSNGFKHRNADGGTANNYANNYIFIAFAESPFQTANAK